MGADSRVVLVVDDDPIVLTGAQERLEAMGYKVFVRDQVLGTSQWVVQNRPWLILLDIMMPAMSGSEFASFLRKRGIDTHIVLHSSKSRADLNQLARGLQALGAIPKGLDDREFEKQFKALAGLAAASGKTSIPA